MGGDHFDESEPRDEKGQWTAGGGAPTAKDAHAAMDERAATAEKGVQVRHAEIDGRKYEVHTDEAKKDDPLLHYAHVYRIRADGKRGAQITSVERVHHALTVSRGQKWPPGS